MYLSYKNVYKRPFCSNIKVLTRRENERVYEYFILVVILESCSPGSVVIKKVENDGYRTKTIQYDPELVSGSTSWVVNRGFTLIELLVVVLIIGILAGVALPQYQKAVAKARYTQMIAAGKSLKDAMELYYMGNGDYPFFWSDLDITYPGCSEGTGRYMLWCDKFAVDMFAGSNKNLLFWDTYGIENGGREQSTAEISSKSQATYTVWLDQSANPGKTSCNSRITGLCQSMGF